MKKEPTDRQIMDKIQEWWTTEFDNWDGDSLYEAVMDLAVDDTEEAEARVGNRASELLEGASILVVWRR